ncbi:MAG: Fic family protein [Pseudomonadota bacterium]
MNLKSLTEKKKHLDNLRPLPEALIQNLDDWLKIELTYSSNAIEGNTLTRRETALVVEKGLTVGGKSLIEHLEATNHAQAIDWVKQQITRHPTGLSEYDILNIHSIILRGIDDFNAGHYRSIPVRISGSTVILPNPRKVPDLMGAFIKKLNASCDFHPVSLGAEAHYDLVTIHPFVDGNGRTARLLMNMIFMMCGYPPAIIRKQDRLKYINALEKAQLGGSKDDFLNIIMRAAERSLDIYLKAMQGENFPLDEDPKLLKIGALAKATHTSHATLRHWIKEGLVQVAETTASGYQLFHSDMITSIERIKDLKKQRFSLQEIRGKI